MNYVAAQFKYPTAGLAQDRCIIILFPPVMGPPAVLCDGVFYQTLAGRNLPRSLSILKGEATTYLFMTRTEGVISNLYSMLENHVEEIQSWNYLGSVSSASSVIPSLPWSFISIYPNRVLVSAPARVAAALTFHLERWCSRFLRVYLSLSAAFDELLAAPSLESESATSLSELLSSEGL